MALERIALAPLPAREGAAVMLWQAAEPEEYLHSLLNLIALFLPRPRGESVLSRIPGDHRWLDRFLTPRSLTGSSIFRRHSGAPGPGSMPKRQDARCRKGLSFPLLRSTGPPGHSTSPLTAEQSRSTTLSYASSTSIVSSCCLTHELTHVLSLLGDLGAALTSLRVAAYYDQAN